MVSPPGAKPDPRSGESSNLLLVDACQFIAFALLAFCAAGDPGPSLRAHLARLGTAAFSTRLSSLERGRVFGQQDSDLFKSGKLCIDSCKNLEIVHDVSEALESSLCSDLIRELGLGFTGIAC